jgi:hypothetical protein
MPLSILAAIFSKIQSGMEGCVSSDSEVIIVQTLVDAVLNSVDINFASASKAVNTLSYENPRLSNAQVNAIIASFLVESDNGMCLRRYGKGREFFRKFGAKAPRNPVNQLSGCQGLDQKFFDACIRDHALALDPVLYRLFCESIHQPRSVIKTVWSNQDDARRYIDEEQQEYRQNLKNEIHNKRLVVLTGIGVSLGMVNDKKLTWTGLLDEIRKMIQTRVSDILPGHEWIGSPEEKAQKLNQAVKAKFPHLDYRQYVSVIMRSIASPDHHHRLAVAIQNLGLPIATTNYDILLDQALGRFEQNLSDVQIRFRWKFDNHRP